MMSSPPRPSATYKFPRRATGDVTMMQAIRPGAYFAGSGAARASSIAAQGNPMKIQMLIAIDGLLENIYHDVKRGAVIDVVESTARRYERLGYAIACPGKPLDVRDLPPAYRTPG
jgi:hypothetical protein